MRMEEKNINLWVSDNEIKNITDINAENINLQEDIQVENNEIKYYPVQVQKFIFMYFVTFWLYPIYWMYKNWEYVKSTNDKYKNSWSWLYALFYPIAMIYFMWEKVFNFKKSEIVLIAGGTIVGSIIQNWLDNYSTALYVEYISWWVFIVIWFILIPVVKKIEEINTSVLSQKSLQFNYRLNLLNILSSVILIPILLFTMWSYLNFIPGTIQEWKSMYSWDVRYLQENNILQADEKLEYFYSMWLLSIKDNWFVITDKDISVYYRWVDNELIIDTVTFDLITQIENSDIDGLVIHTLEWEDEYSYTTGIDNFNDEHRVKAVVDYMTARSGNLK